MFADDEPLTRRTLRFDHWLTPKSDALQALADHLFRQLEARRPVPLGRRPRSDAVERRRLMVTTLTCNLAACVLLVPAPERLLVSTAQVATTRYDRRALPHRVIAWAVTEFEALGFAHRWPGMRGQVTTSLEPSERFCQLLASYGIGGAAEIGRTPGAESVILKAAASDAHGIKRLLNYRDTADTRRMRAELDELTAFINASNVTAVGEAHLPIHLVRQFQVESPQAPQQFNAHGRIYGWWGITMPRDQRHRIRIGGECCADLDFVAMLTNLAYAYCGEPLPAGDPYCGLPGLDMPTPAQREAIKAGINALYFNNGLLKRLPSDVKAGLGPDWSASRFIESVRARHPAIAHLFGSRIGLHLLYLESEIMMRTLLDLMADSIVACSIHDGLCVRLRDADQAADAMRAAARDTMGVTLPVKVKAMTLLGT